jgi:hypothetical protein
MADGARGRERVVSEFDARRHAARIREQIALAVFGDA